MTRTNTLFSALIVAGLSVATVISAGEAIAEGSSPAKLSLDVRNVEAFEGRLMIALFKGEEGWKTNTAADAKAVPAAPVTVSVEFHDLTPGEYGIKIYHDVNNDGKLNLGNFGIPSEPYGFSNNAPVRFGPPNWTKAHFIIADGENTHTVALK